MKPNRQQYPGMFPIQPLGQGDRPAWPIEYQSQGRLLHRPACQPEKPALSHRPEIALAYMPVDPDPATGTRSQPLFQEPVCEVGQHVGPVRRCWLAKQWSLGQFMSPVRGGGAIQVDDGAQTRGPKADL